MWIKERKKIFVLTETTELETTHTDNKNDWYLSLVYIRRQIEVMAKEHKNKTSETPLGISYSL